ncbi:unnamed protein product [Blepharisma stoltei]|uniref:VASt domain-containing protein n=1 Tax=Blepharisma stoltei TaxID=1481888 RepID=A0AAU9K2E4_9CILI|nr:unnamed protein product [Blepharisma stoltei]
MGCCEATQINPRLLSRIEIPLEEKAIKKQERELAIFQRSAKELKYTFKTNSKNGLITLPMLKRSIYQLGLNFDEIYNNCSPTYKLFQSLSNEEGFYNSNDIELCAVLLGSGSAKDKLLILFEHIDKSADGVLYKDETCKVLKQMIDLSLNKIPTSINSENYLSSIELKEYIESLVKSESKFLDKVFQSIFNNDSDEVSIEDLEKMLCEYPKLERLVWSSGIRISLYEESNLYSHPLKFSLEYFEECDKKRNRSLGCENDFSAQNPIDNPVSYQTFRNQARNKTHDISDFIMKEKSNALEKNINISDDMIPSSVFKYSLTDAPVKFDISVVKFFQLFLADDAEEFRLKYHSVAGDTNLKVGKWSKPPPGVFSGIPGDGWNHTSTRNVSYIHPLHDRIPMMPAKSETKEEYKIYFLSKDELILDVVLWNRDVPYGNYFRCCMRWIITGDPTCTVDIRFGVDFVKKTIFRGKIEKTSLEQSRKAINTLWLPIAMKIIQESSGKPSKFAEEIVMKHEKPVTIIKENKTWHLWTIILVLLLIIIFLWYRIVGLENEFRYAREDLLLNRYANLTSLSNK